MKKRTQRYDINRPRSTHAPSILNIEVRNSRVTKSSYEIELHNVTSHTELLTERFL